MIAIEAPFWIYWLLCGVICSFLIRHHRFWLGLLPSGAELRAGQGYQVAVISAWAMTLITGIYYVLTIQKQGQGSYQLIDLILFSGLNGSVEQGMFIFWFLLGVYGADQIRMTRSALRFTAGFISYSIYSGAIHAGFWSRFLPEHTCAGPILITCFLMMSLTWMVLLWRYTAILSLILMHGVIDFITVGHLQFDGFN